MPWEEEEEPPGRMALYSRTEILELVMVWGQSDVVWLTETWETDGIRVATRMPCCLCDLLNNKKKKQREASKGKMRIQGFEEE